MEMKVTIVVPIYNVQEYIGRCLNSVLKQTYKNLEIICVDDCGQDKSMDIVEEYHKRYPEIIKIIYSTENVGLGGARDKGIQRASGEYIFFIDSDDYVKEDYVEKYVETAKKENADLVVGGYIRDYGAKYKEYPVKRDDPFFVWVNVSAWAKVYRTSFLKKNNLNFNGIRIYEDECYIYKLLLKCPRKALIDYSGYYYWFNPQSITKSKEKDRSEFFLKYALNIRKFILEYKEECENNLILRYCLASGLTANLLYNGQKSGKKINKLYKEYNEILDMLDKNIYKNEYIKLKYVKSEPKKRKYAMWLVMAARKIHLDKVLVRFVGVI